MIDDDKSRVPQLVRDIVDAVKTPVGLKEPDGLRIAQVLLGGAATVLESRFLIDHHADLLRNSTRSDATTWTDAAVYDEFSAAVLRDERAPWRDPRTPHFLRCSIGFFINRSYQIIAALLARYVTWRASYPHQFPSTGVAVATTRKYMGCLGAATSRTLFKGNDKFPQLIAWLNSVVAAHLETRRLLPGDPPSSVADSYRDRTLLARIANPVVVEAPTAIDSSTDLVSVVGAPAIVFCRAQADQFKHCSSGTFRIDKPIHAFVVESVITAWALQFIAHLWQHAVTAHSLPAK